jgi:hypothetical protein
MRWTIWDPCRHELIQTIESHDVIYNPVMRRLGPHSLDRGGIIISELLVLYSAILLTGVSSPLFTISHGDPAIARGLSIILLVFSALASLDNDNTEVRFPSIILIVYIYIYIVVYTYAIVTPDFKVKIRCLLYVCPESSYHTYD